MWSLCDLGPQRLGAATVSCRHLSIRSPTSFESVSTPCKKTKFCLDFHWSQLVMHMSMKLSVQQVDCVIAAQVASAAMHGG